MLETDLASWVTLTDQHMQQKSCIYFSNLLISTMIYDVVFLVEWVMGIVVSVLKVYLEKVLNRIYIKTLLY